MQFIVVVWKTHIANQYPVTGFRVAVFVGKQEVVVAVHLKTFFRQLRPVLAPLFDREFATRFVFCSVVRIEGDCEVAVGQLRYLFGEAQGINTIKAP